MKSRRARTSSGRAHDGTDRQSAIAPPAPSALGSARVHPVTPLDDPRGAAIPSSGSPTASTLDGTGAAEDRQEAWERDRAELVAAIAMVADHYAARVVLVGLHAPEAAVAALAVTAAGRGVALRLLEPTQDGNVSVVAQRR